MHKYIYVSLCLHKHIALFRYLTVHESFNLQRILVDKAFTLMIY